MAWFVAIQNKNRVQDFESLLAQLKRALRTDGDFPARARTVSNLISLANNPSTPIHKIAEVLLGETSLGARVLYTVNSVYFQGLRPIVTVTEAVIRIGMRNLCDLFAGLVLMQGFVPLARRGGIFADNLKRSLITALLASSLASETENDEIAEQGYLAGSFYNLGYLLLAYYFPRLYDMAGQRAAARDHDVTQSINEMIGIDPAQLALEILDALKIPVLYHDVIREAYKPLAEREGDTALLNLAGAVAAAGRLADAIINGKDRSRLEAAIDDLASEGTFPRERYTELLDELPEMFQTHCQVTGMSFLKLPTYLDRNQDAKQLELDEFAQGQINESFEQFAEYVEIIQQAIDDQEPIGSVITSAMEALVFALKYDRVMLLLADQNRSNLSGKMALGKEFEVDPRQLKRRVAAGKRNRPPDISAFLEGAPSVNGDPLFTGCAPFAAIPIGCGERAIGVIYADMAAERGEEQRLPYSLGIKPALETLTELLDRSLSATKS